MKLTGLNQLTAKYASPPSRGVWIETFIPKLSDRTLKSPPSRGVWIETGYGDIA